MERTAGAVLPPGLRLRRVQPLLDRERSCPLLYDLERGLLLDVPAAFRLHLARALEAGDPDGELVAWLAAEDLLTYDDPPGRPAAVGWPGLATSGGLGAVWFAEDAWHCHPPPGDGRGGLAAVERLLAGTGPGSRCIVHLVAEGELARPLPLRRVVAGVLRLGWRAGRTVTLEVTADGRSLSPALAGFFAAHDVALRLTGGSNDLVCRLLRRLGDRLTLCARLDTGDRLLDLWRRAVALGVHRLDVTKVADRVGAGATPGAELREYRRDLFAVADATFEALSAGRAPQPLFEPLARVVRRQLSGRPVAVGSSGSAGYLGLLGPGGLFPLFAPTFARAQRAAGRLPSTAGSRPPAACPSCWGRRLCARGSDAIAEPGPLHPPPRPDRCELWCAELEVGLLLHRRLERTDPALFLALAGGCADVAFFDPYAWRAGDGLTAS